MKDWKQKYNDDLLFYETFIDTDKYKGTCYLADNWIDVGLSKGANFHGTKYGGIKWQLADVTTHVAVSKKIILLKPVYNNKKMYKMLSRIGLKSLRFYKEPMTKPPEFKSDDEKAKFKGWLDEFTYGKKLIEKMPIEPEKHKIEGKDVSDILVDGHVHHQQSPPSETSSKELVWVEAEIVEHDEKDNKRGDREDSDKG